jgi:hypothetical protein
MEMWFRLETVFLFEESRVALLRTDVSEESIASIIRVTRSSKLRKTLAVTSTIVKTPNPA